jgi:hypothetical protein
LRARLGSQKAQGPGCFGAGAFASVGVILSNYPDAQGSLIGLVLS